VNDATFPKTNVMREGCPAVRVHKGSEASAFPKSVPDCFFPKLALEDGKMGMIALNE
jgi:hypothetical protein